jgi:hypothetical protein
MALRVFIFLLLLSFSGQAQLFSFKMPKKKSVYKMIDAEEMIRRYIVKEYMETSVEGIYSVSCVIRKKGPTLLSQVERERTLVRKENYAKVAILKDWPGSKTEFVEVAISDNGDVNGYPLVAELSSLSEGGGFIYKHFEPDGKVMSFTFIYDSMKPDILEGVYSFVKGNQTITYTLTYLKTYPKHGNFTPGRQ